MELLRLLLGMLVVLGLGLGARRIGLLTEGRRERVNAYAYYVALPALIVASTYTQPLSEVLSVTLVAGVAVVLLATATIAAVVHRRLETPAERSVAIVQSYHANLGYVGVPVVATTFGDLTTAKAALVLAVASLLQILLTVLLLSTMNDAATSLAGELRGVVLNPAILAVVAGLVASSIGLALPPSVDWALTSVGDTALWAALLCVGAALQLEAETIDVRTVSSVVGVKMVAMPLVAVAVFALLQADPSTTRAGVAMFAMPTAVSTYVFAAELGGDRELASLNVFATTIVSAGSLLVVVHLLGTLL